MKTPISTTSTTEDERFMGACLRLALRHEGLTGTNPAVGTLLVNGGQVVGTGITARGGRPHAERLALDEAGAAARGSTAYVSLEPCAHHGVTPPCAQALIDAGVSRVFTAWTDPDSRVDGQGHAMLERAGITVHTGVCKEQARRNMLGYLTRKTLSRPMVTVKLALSADNMLGRVGQEVPITGAMAKTMVHMMRARHDAILTGRGTVQADDPSLTVRLPGLQDRSPHRFVLDRTASLSPSSQLAQTARTVPVTLVSETRGLPAALRELGVRHGASEIHNGQIALPELLDDMAAQGITSVMVEAGAMLAGSVWQQGLADRIVLFRSGEKLMDGPGEPIESSIIEAHLQGQYAVEESLTLGSDTVCFYVRK